MNDKKFYIITFIEFALYKLLYSIYLPFIFGIIRYNNIIGLLPFILTYIPVALFFILAFISVKYGKNHLDLWSWKKFVITLLVIIIPQLIPLPF